jgi:hypothetical protein
MIPVMPKADKLWGQAPNYFCFFFLPGSVTLKPPHFNRTKAIILSMFLNPYAMRIVTLILLFTASILAFDNSFLIEDKTASLCRFIFFPSSTNSGILHRAAHDSNLPSSSAAASGVYLNTVRRPSLSKYARYSLLSDLISISMAACWFCVRFSGFFNKVYF